MEMKEQHDIDQQETPYVKKLIMEMLFQKHKVKIVHFRNASRFKMVYGH